jgi:UDP-N-acetylenolpyruvoylglucosamine reductase
VEQLQTEVKNQFGIEIEPEIRLVEKFRTIENM